MGVSGCGKTTTGQALADALGWPFFDGDDFHPEANVAKMANGQPLTDDDRWPWLDRIAEEMRGIHARGDSAVFACSALKESLSSPAVRRRRRPAGPLEGRRGDDRRAAGASRAPLHAGIAAPFAVRHARRAQGWAGHRHSGIGSRPDRADLCRFGHRGAGATMSDTPRRKATQVGHLGRAPRKFMGAVNTPVFRATTMLFESVADLDAAVRGEYDGIGYGLHGLPTVTDLQDAIADTRRRSCRAGRSVGIDRDDATAAGARESGRPHPRHRFRVRADAPLLRPAPEAPGRRGRATTIRCWAPTSRASSGRTPGSSSSSRRDR